jgi:hypothetical protein
MRIEDQLARLSELGLKLNEGITLEDLLISFDRISYEEQPFDLILFVLGIEVEQRPWGRRICSRVWNFDTECINEIGDYTNIVKKLCELVERPQAFQEIGDFIDWDRGEAWIRCIDQGVPRRWNLKVDNDWADMATLSSIMADIEGEDRRFYHLDNGQAMILFHLEEEAARTLQSLTKLKITPYFS